MRASLFFRFAGLATLLGVVTTSFAQFNLPSGSANEIGFQGSSTDAGVSGYQGVDSSTKGHTLISDNAPAGVAYYYVAGRPDGPAPTATPYAAAGTTAAGFTQFRSNLTTFGYSLSDVTLHFGPSASVYENSWNLGADSNGLNASTGAALNPGGALGVSHQWEAWSGSSIEDRFYSANPAQVFYHLELDGTEIIEIGYADLFMRIDYGDSTSGSDDEIQAYHTISGVSAAAGLSGNALAIAQAFVSDVDDAGGGLQVIIDSVQPAVTGLFTYNGQFGSHFAIEGRLAAVSAVPEPGTYAMWLAALALGLTIWHRRRSAGRSQATVVATRP